MSLSPITLTAAEATALRTRALVAPAAWSVLRVQGPGALTCLQGLLTNDLDAPGDGSVVYGALLTPKGMIVVDAWVLRLSANDFMLLLEASAREAVLDIFRRTLPPRLARVRDASDMLQVLRLYGPEALRALDRAGLPHGPRPVSTIGDQLLARTPATAPFHALAVVPVADREVFTALLASVGIEAGSEAQAEAARIVAGWPRLGAEIGERTLPQEVRFDEIGGVSYSKGCYTGQETVARLHFRGHTNKELRGVLFEGHAFPGGGGITVDGKPVGELSSWLGLPRRALALAQVRREIEPGSTIYLDNLSATLISLPFALDLVA